MSKYKTYEYIWLDGYQPEPSMRSKVKATDASTPQIGLLMDHQHNKLKVVAQTVCFCRFKHTKILMVMI